MTKTQDKWSQKRMKTLETEWFKEAYKKATEATRREKNECPHGHALTPQNVCVWVLRKTGRLACLPCYRAAQVEWRKTSAKSAAGPSKPRRKK